jgi:primosomal replication protein N
LTIQNGAVVFEFPLLDRREFLDHPSVFSYWSVDGQRRSIELKAGSLAYTFCQIPIILQGSNENFIQVHLTDGSTQQVEGHGLDFVNSSHIFRRDGMVHHLVVSVSPNQ